MALLQRRVVQIGRDVLKQFTASVHTDSFTDGLFKELEEKKAKDMPVAIKNPYTKEKPKCILCKLDIEPNFKNVRLLSQFVSRYTGKIYGRHITGLCAYKQTKLEKEILKARSSGMMGVYMKNPNYLADPDLYDPSNPIKPHPY